jgi:hypothetical protein
MREKKIKTSREIGEKIKKMRYENGMNKLVENIQLVADALSVPVSYFYEAEKPLMFAEKTVAYQAADESRLLKYFRKIKHSGSKNTVIQVARIAAKAD